MSQELISHSPDLKRLRDEGYDVQIRANHLIVNNVPYVNSNKEVKLGILVSELTLAGDRATRPGTHVVYFVGDHPCNKDGTEITAIKHASAPIKIDDKLIANHSFSNKPSEGYADYYAKMARYITIISNPARSIDPNVTAITFPVATSENESSVFQYIDTASSRSGIYAVTKKLELGPIAIVGVGGTGAYILDLVAKTPVSEIHLFDGDNLSNHNAFRSPGAPSVEQLRAKPRKVTYFAEQYSRMRRKIVPHDYFIDAANVDQLQEMDFVFVCIDSGNAKKVIVEKLEQCGKPFIDVGMGVYETDTSLAGIVRVTSSTTGQRAHVHKRMSLADGNGDDDYSRNIQIADLNALNAALAVIKWKKLFGFYVDLENEHHSTYTINGNVLTNEDMDEPSSRFHT